jgi:hypothetical protein
MPLGSAPLSVSAEFDDVTYRLEVYRTVVDGRVYLDGTDVTRAPR